MSFKVVEIANSIVEMLNSPICSESIVTSEKEKIVGILKAEQDYQERCTMFASISAVLRSRGEFGTDVLESIRMDYDTDPRTNPDEPLIEYPIQPIVKESPLEKLDINKCIPGKFVDIFNAITVFNRVNPEMVIGPFIAVLNTCVMGKAVINSISNHNEELPLWTYTIADSGNNKSGVLNTLSKPLKHAEDQVNKANMTAIATYKRDLTKVKKKLQAYEKKKDPTGYDDEQNVSDWKEYMQLKQNPVLESNVILDDVTPEGIVNSFSKHGDKTAVHSVLTDESSAIESLCGILYTANGVSNLGAILSSYDGKEISRVRAKTDEIQKAKHPLLSVGVMGQSKKFGKILESKGADGNGFIERFWCVFPERANNKSNYLDAPELNQDIYSRYESIINRLWRMPTPDQEHMPVLRFNKLAKSTIVKDYFDHCEEMKNYYAYAQYYNDTAVAWYSKQFARFARLAATYHLACGYSPEEEINEDTAMKAIETSKFFESQQTRVFESNVTRTEQEDKLLKLIAILKTQYSKIGTSVLDARGLFRIFGRNLKSMKETEEYLGILSHCFLLIETDVSTKRGIKSAYKINPWIETFKY